MNTIEHDDTTAGPAASTTTDPLVREPTGRIGRVTALSMTVGAVAALILAVVVFEGATEPVVTGVVLLAFAASWAMLAALSVRLTDRPQLWALVPAGIMGGLGVASLVLRPGDDALSTLSWVWPVGLLALAAWMTVQSRRSLPGWSRRVVLSPILGLMVVGSVGGAYERVRESQDRSTYDMPGDLVDVGAHRMHIHCTGTGSPTVVLEDGLGEGSTRMSGWIAPAVAESTRVCVYDRAGRGWSEPGPDGADPLAVVDDLHTLLERHGEKGPFVLAGHSSGGVYVQAFAATHPDEVAGMVLIDSQPAEAFTGLPDYPAFYSGFRKASGLASPAARFGVMRLLHATDGAGLPTDQRDEARALASTAGHNRSFRDELAALPAVMERARSLTALGDEPLIVLTAEKDAQTGWLPLQDEMALLSTNSAHRAFPDATHSSFVETEAGAATTSDAIADVVEAVRTHSQLP